MENLECFSCIVSDLHTILVQFSLTMYERSGNVLELIGCTAEGFYCTARVGFLEQMILTDCINGPGQGTAFCLIYVG